MKAISDDMLRIAADKAAQQAGMLGTSTHRGSLGLTIHEWAWLLDELQQRRAEMRRADNRRFVVAALWCGLAFIAGALLS